MSKRNLTVGEIALAQTFFGNTIDYNQVRIGIFDKVLEGAAMAPFGEILYSSSSDPNDWKSGDNLWLVDLIAPFGGMDKMVADLKAKVFADREVNFLFTKDGKREVKSV